jgi:hypothetical protein
MDVAGDKNRYITAVKDFHEVTVPQLQRKFLDTTALKGPIVRDLLEHHARAFILDELLSSLGWTIRPKNGDAFNLFTEAFFRPKYPRAHTQFLDYLGVDSAVESPLMVFEAKRLCLAPPSELRNQYNSRKAGRSAVRQRTRKVFPTEEVFAEAISLPAWVTGEWKKHITQLRKYFDAVMLKFGTPPGVMAIGNGEWMLIIRQPELVFRGKPNAGCFRVIEEPDSPAGEAYRLNYERIHTELAYEAIAPRAPYVPPEWIPQDVRQAPKVEIMRGLRVGYTCTQTPQRPGYRPHVDVSPVVFVRLPRQSWIGVTVSADGFNLPHETEGAVQLKNHLRDVGNASDALVKRVRETIAADPTVIELVAHFGDSNSLATRPGMTREISAPDSITQSFVLVTGSKSHFIQLRPRVQCPYHQWSKCDTHAVGRFPASGPIHVPSYSGTRAFFPNGRAHHCAADVTAKLKSAPRLASTQLTGGISTNAANPAFCQIFDFEGMLCCQTCVFFDVCAQAQSFRLPCMTVLGPAVVAPAIQPVP